jgi:glycosyltransferase involved in cell wall biosynthesis
VIALLQGAPAFGAVERYVVAVAEGLSSADVETVLIYPDVPELEPFGRIGGSVRAFPLDPELISGPAPQLVRRLVTILRELKPQVVHVTDVWPAALVAARMGQSRRLLVTHHTPELPRHDNLAGKTWWRLGWLARPEVVYTSESDRRTDGRRFLRGHVVPLGIDLERFHRPTGPPNTTAPTIGNVARLAAQKGQRTLIEAAPLVLERYSAARFVIVGDGELREELLAVAHDLGLEDRIILTGARGDVPDLLATFDVFAFPSHFEGLCLAVIEAQAAGVPVVATSVGAIPENVVPRETGLLVQPDRPGDLAAAILQLLDDPAAAERMAVEAQRRVLERYSETQMVERTLALYGISA